MRYCGVILLCWLFPLLVSAEGLELRVEAGDIDVAHRTIHFKLSTVAEAAEIEVFSPEGNLLHSGRATYDSSAPHARLPISWPDLGDGGENFRIELKVTDSKARWVTFQVIRFYLEVPHKEVEFESGKWTIRKAQESKLSEPLSLLKEAASKYADLMNVSLYVAGHTDTVGKAADNQRLSERRAHAIATYFVSNGLANLPIFVRGFGEGALAVKTADNVDEPRNRRAAYIISSFMPELQGPGSFKRLR